MNVTQDDLADGPAVPASEDQKVERDALDDPVSKPRHADRMRAWLVALLIGPMPVLAALAVVGAFIARSDAAETAQRVLSVFAGLAGAILGFYFGQRSRMG